jgi:redox-regulated HSP33 family molecular chaperone
MLRSINKDELPNLKDENGELVVDCEFCKKRRVFSADLKTH